MNAASRLTDIHGRIARAAKLAHRSPEEVTLIAVSKTHDAETIRPLLAAAHCDFGENRVQEAAAKWPDLKADYPGARLHLIGQLQSNKAEQAVEIFDAIHSVDRPSLIDALAKAMASRVRRPDCFVQVNLAEEEQKGGCAVADLPDLLSKARDAGLPVVGLMCLPPEGIEPAPWFALLAELAARNDLPALSMGMSSDFETAIMLGATHVRVGTALFGERHAGNSEL